PALYQGTSNRGLLDDMRGVMRRIGAQDATGGARLFDYAGQVGPGDLFAIAKPQACALDPLLDQVILKRGLVLEIDLRAAAADLVKRRLRDIEMPRLDQFGHLPEKEGQQQRADMCAVDVGIGHDDDLVVTQLFKVEFVASD